jgi:hypothetical protein
LATYYVTDDNFRLEVLSYTNGDNSTEFTSMAILKWVQDTGIGWQYIAPGPNRTALSKASMANCAPLMHVWAKSKAILNAFVEIVIFGLFRMLRRHIFYSYGC